MLYEVIGRVVHIKDGNGETICRISESSNLYMHIKKLIDMNRKIQIIGDKIEKQKYLFNNYDFSQIKQKLDLLIRLNDDVFYNEAYRYAEINKSNPKYFGLISSDRKMLYKAAKKADEIDSMYGYSLNAVDENLDKDVPVKNVHKISDTLDEALRGINKMLGNRIREERKDNKNNSPEPFFETSQNGIVNSRPKKSEPEVKLNTLGFQSNETRDKQTLTYTPKSLENKPVRKYRRPNYIEVVDGEDEAFTRKYRRPSHIEITDKKDEAFTRKYRRPNYIEVVDGEDEAFTRKYRRPVNYKIDVSDNLNGKKVYKSKDAKKVRKLSGVLNTVRDAMSKAKDSNDISKTQEVKRIIKKLGLGKILLAAAIATTPITLNVVHNLGNQDRIDISKTYPEVTPYVEESTEKNAEESVEESVAKSIEQNNEESNAQKRPPFIMVDATPPGHRISDIDSKPKENVSTSKANETQSTDSKGFLESIALSDNLNDEMVSKLVNAIEKSNNKVPSSFKSGYMLSDLSGASDRDRLANFFKQFDTKIGAVYNGDTQQLSYQMIGALETVLKQEIADAIESNPNIKTKIDADEISFYGSYGSDDRVRSYSIQYVKNGKIRYIAHSSDLKKEENRVLNNAIKDLLNLKRAVGKIAVTSFNTIIQDATKGGYNALRGFLGNDNLEIKGLNNGSGIKVVAKESRSNDLDEI